MNKIEMVIEQASIAGCKAGNQITMATENRAPPHPAIRGI